MKNRMAVLLTCVLLAASAALAHGGETHVIGTVTRITTGSITVKTTSNTMVTVGVVAETTFTNSKTKAAAKLTDLAVGDRVVIHAKEPTEGTLVADTVEFAPATSKPAAPKPAQ